MNGRRIAIVLDGYAPLIAGAETMAWEAAAVLAGRGAEVTVVSVEDPPLAHDVPGVRHRRLGRPVDADALLDRLGHVPDVIHGFDLARPDLPAAGAELALRLGRPWLLTPASTMDVWPDHAAGLELCRRAAAVLTLSPGESRRLAAAGVPPDRCRCVGHAAPGPAATPDPDRFRSRHGIDGRIVLFLGRKVEAKGYHLLHLAAPAITAGAAEPTCVVAMGSGRGVPSDHVIDVDRATEEEKWDALAACDVLLLPTTADLFPLVFIEAWMLSKPVVTTRFEGAEAVVRHGVDGLVVDADPGSVSDAVLGILGDRPAAARLGASGRRRTVTSLNRAAVGRALVAVHDDLGVRSGTGRGA